ncbi:hypothetical protein EXIGLDRAFT_284645 [Exidia glandulosa HHB12029]|uniref:Uncharacterized protein n=1 Tax=Exidia glandulosa HHB12029 TaxID=1314781 RepID=A0A165M3L4_EXIGL|nr:hypothetical protein EXIGLDRAFT_284645 [Exidia glandulosa HHB12029]
MQGSAIRQRSPSVPLSHRTAPHHPHHRTSHQSLACRANTESLFPHPAARAGAGACRNPHPPRNLQSQNVSSRRLTGHRLRFPANANPRETYLHVHLILILSPPSTASRCHALVPSIRDVSPDEDVTVTPPPRVPITPRRSTDVLRIRFLNSFADPSRASQAHHRRSTRLARS